MKILLFGEYSGLFNCLRDGLVECGHDVTMASDGNGYKNYPRDIDWYAPPKLGRLKHVIELKKVFEQRKKLKGYDVVLVINPTIFSRYVPIIKPIFNYLFENNEKVFLSGAGLTSYSFNYWYNSKEKYHNYVAGELIDIPSVMDGMKSKALLDWEDEFMNRINGYIPIWYEYAQPFRQYKTCLQTVRIPINYGKHEYAPNVVKDKIVFFASISARKNAKGFPYIQAAFEKMKEKYGNIAEFIAAGGLPFNEYMELISRTNVLLDDANSYSIAMNGLFSMCKGKVVMGGAEPAGNRELGIDGVNPVINLCPDVDQICSCIEDVIKNRDKIEEMGKKGRLFVEQYHDYRDIAKQYVELFENY